MDRADEHKKGVDKFHTLFHFFLLLRDRETELADELARHFFRPEDLQQPKPCLHRCLRI